MIQAGSPWAAGSAAGSAAAAMASSLRQRAWPSGQVCRVETAARPDLTVVMSQPAAGSTRYSPLPVK